jgi:hypothetical protein
MGGKGVARETEGAYPQLSSDIDLTAIGCVKRVLRKSTPDAPVGIENSAARWFAGHGLVENWW